MDMVSAIEKLKQFIPMYLWEKINHPAGYVVSAEEFNSKWNLNVTQGDHHSEFIEAMVEAMLIILTGEGGVIDLLSSVESVDFYDNGYKVTYSDGTIKEWQYSVNMDGFITSLTNLEDNRSIGLTWHDEIINPE